MMLGLHPVDLGKLLAELTGFADCVFPTIVGK
jgi:hypothetical protein